MVLPDFQTIEVLLCEAGGLGDVLFSAAHEHWMSKELLDSGATVVPVEPRKLMLGDAVTDLRERPLSARLAVLTAGCQACAEGDQQ